jgi:NADH:ubiquinone oxidoreductase subunit 6 (subunit J)
MDFFDWIFKTNKMLVGAFFFMLIFSTIMISYAFDEAENEYQILLATIIPVSGLIALVINMISLYKKNNKK